MHRAVIIHINKILTLNTHFLPRFILSVSISTSRDNADARGVGAKSELKSSIHPSITASLSNDSKEI